MLNTGKRMFRVMEHRDPLEKRGKGVRRENRSEAM